MKKHQDENKEQGSPYIPPLDPRHQKLGQRKQKEWNKNAVIPDLRDGQCKDNARQEDKSGAGI